MSSTASLAATRAASPPAWRMPGTAGRLEFRKVHGAGNDFVLVSGPFACADLPGLARELCSRRTGVGADGLVVSTRITGDPRGYEVRCLNADGSEASMCGNALRCAALCAAADHGHTEISMLMAGVLHRARVRGTEVAVTVEAGPVLRAAVTVGHGGRVCEFDSVHTGTEHAVAFVADVDVIDVEGFGSLVRRHRSFDPAGTNVSFAQAAGPSALRIRTYERGVEEETLSCGSAAVAAAVAGQARRLIGDGPVTVGNRARAPLTVRPDTAGSGTFWVSGPAVIVYRGQI
jgi:diaminopimelate epimerase